MDLIQVQMACPLLVGQNCSTVSLSCTIVKVVENTKNVDILVAVLYR